MTATDPNAHQATAPLNPGFQEIAAAAMTILAEDPRFKVGQADIRGQTYRVFENAPASLVAFFQLGAAHGDRDFLYFQDETYSFAETWSRALRFADGLRRTYGIGKGDRVAIAMRNYPEWCMAYMGVIALGAVVVPLNAWWKSEELAYAVEDSGVKHIIVDARRLAYLDALRADKGLKLILAREEAAGADATFDELVAMGEARLPDADIRPDDDFCIVYTSGSTGAPKGVILTHRGAISTLMSWAFLSAALTRARGGVSMFGDNPGILLGIPLFHVTGSHSIFMLSYLVGRRVAMIYRWDPREAVDLIKRHGLTNFVGVPSQSFELMEAAGDEALPTLIDIGSGGAKRPPEHVRMLKERFRQANPSSGYGLSETNAVGTVCSLADYQRKPDAAGRPVPPLTDIKCVGENGDCAPGQVGEVWIRSPGNFRGYLNKPEDTAKAITPDGWFRTGDLGKFDEEGFLYIVDRIKDLIIRGGENISCLEVEGRAYEHPEVAEACVFSVPDDVLGERVGLVVFPKKGAEIDAAALSAFMAETLAGFKTPERIWVSPMPLPRLGTAKFDKISIRQVALRVTPALAV